MLVGSSSISNVSGMIAQQHSQHLTCHDWLSGQREMGLSGLDKEVLYTEVTKSSEAASPVELSK